MARILMVGQERPWTTLCRWLEGMGNTLVRTEDLAAGLRLHQQEPADLLLMNLRDVEAKPLAEAVNSFFSDPRNLEKTLEEITIQDVLDRMQRKVEDAAAVEAAISLVSAIAHDFNNLLTIIGGYSAHLKQQMSVDDPLRKDVIQINEASKRGNLLTRQLLAFRRLESLPKELLDVNKAVADMAEMMDSLMPDGVRLEAVHSPQPLLVNLTPGHLEQILLNLVINAREAMAGWGTITVETSSVHLDTSHAQSQGVRPGYYVQISVKDEGVGMDPSVLARVFDPQFTTKAKGRGLGLSTVYHIVKQNEGNIWAESVPERGTEFRVHLPRATEQVDPVAPEART